MNTATTLTSDQMRALEQAAISSGDATGLELMERAGRGVVEAIFEEWPELEHAFAPEVWDETHEVHWGDLSIWAKRAVVFCGPGNNGGDGFVVARLLRELKWEVSVFFYGDAERLGPDARRNYDLWVGESRCYDLGFPNLNPADADEFLKRTDSLTGTPLIVDALLGIGLSRPLEAFQPIFENIEHFGFLRFGETPIRAPRCVAIDIPSGLNSDTGEAPICDPITSLYFLAVHADLTVTFHSKKIGHESEHAKVLCGNIIVKDIGL
ncbi:NAD(P)H-hydrate epimerase [Litoreibacter janthinus]|uniref:NAD(P)H-hydrate epimerase n=1 Tax=Litoreibacter janthinus TaxID=670154 RepID=A0A1I6HB84_9RHOB|nr:yjeF N-terminal region [Litoreibacter janthinus]